MALKLEFKILRLECVGRLKPLLLCGLRRHISTAQQEPRTGQRVFLETARTGKEKLVDAPFTGRICLSVHVSTLVIIQLQLLSGWSRVLLLVCFVYPYTSSFGNCIFPFHKVLVGRLIMWLWLSSHIVIGHQKRQETCYGQPPESKGEGCPLPSSYVPEK